MLSSHFQSVYHQLPTAILFSHILLRLSCQTPLLIFPLYSFFYNASKAESVWEKPEALVQLEAGRLAAMHSQQMAKVSPMLQTRPLHHHHMHTHLHHQPPIMPSALGPPPGPAGTVWMQQVLAVEVQKRQLEERNKQAEEEERIRAQQQAAVASAAARMLPVDKSKPVSSTPISGTPWCVVWTGDGRVFFYNPSTKTSVWERPEELAERADVTKAMSTVPEQLLASNPANVVPTSRTVPNVTAMAAPTLMSGLVPTMARVKEGQAESETEEDEENVGFPSKKFKGDDNDQHDEDDGEWREFIEKFDNLKTKSFQIYQRQLR